MKHDTIYMSVDNGDASAGGGGGGAEKEAASSAVPSMFESRTDAPKADIAGLLGEEYAGNELFKQFENSADLTKDLAKSFAELHEKASKPAQLLGENATDEEKREFWKSLGVPEDTKGYGFEKPESWPEGVPYDQEHADKWAQKMLENNVPVEVANALRNDFLAEVSAQASEASQKLDVMLKEAYGDKALQRGKEIGASIKEVFPDDKQIDALMQGLPDGALLVIGKLQDHLKAKYGATDDGDEGDSQSTGLTAEEARTQGRALMQHKAYNDAMHPEHQSIRAQAKALYAQATQLAEAQRKRRA